MSDKVPEEKPTFFVSRRGRQVGVHQVDLSDMNIDSDEVATVPQETGAKTTAPRPKPVAPKSPRQPRQWSKKKVTVLAVIIAVLLLPVAAAELLAAQYRQGSTAAQADLSSLIAETVLPAQKKESLTSDAIRSMANQVNDIVARMCRGGMLDNAAGLYPRAQDALGDCKTNQALYASLSSDLYELEKQARYLEAVDTLMKPVATPITDDYAVIGAQQSLWQTADEGLKKVSVPDPMRSAHGSLSSHVSAVAAAWSALNTANNEQTALPFTEAEQKLATEYEAVRSVSAEFIEILNQTQTDLFSSYSKLK